MHVSENSNSEDVDLNIVPIIDCFTVLIAYLLAAASFLSLTVFDVGVAIQSESVAISDLPKDPPMAMTVQIEMDHKVVLKISGGKQNVSKVITVDAISGALDLKGLEEKISGLQKKYPTLAEPSITADVDVLYKDVVKVVGATRKSFPKLYLAGNYEKQVQ